MNQFGGRWTERKMEIVVDYAKAYLKIMAGQNWVKTIYFDGFAGSGLIGDEEGEDLKKGTALRILDIKDPKPFDIYYFVELNDSRKSKLQQLIKDNFPGKGRHVTRGDCNKKMVDLAQFLTVHKSYRALAFIDPYGMSVKWASIEALKGLGVDLWILVPTGVGANRLLKTNGEISDSWYSTLEQFLGLSRQEIERRFYNRKTVHTLFGDETSVSKLANSIDKLGELYSERLREVFNYVSDPFIMRNSMNSIMYHFMMATNNSNGLKIANDVIKPKYEG